MKIAVTCAYCGESLERTPAQVRKNTTGNFFCSNAHRTAYEKEHGSVTKGKHIVRGRRRVPEALSTIA